MGIIYWLTKSVLLELKADVILSVLGLVLAYLFTSNIDYLGYSLPVVFFGILSSILLHDNRRK